MTTAGIGKIPRKTKSRKGQGVQAGAGRPKGSYKFSIPGRGPVPIHVYKKWVTQQKALARIKALEQVKTIQEEQAQTAEGEFEEVQQIQQQVIQQPIQQPPQQFQQVKRPQPTQQIQQQGVARGDLDFASRGVLTPTGGNILDAPNINKGELTNVGGIPVVRLGERPQANPDGEVYTNIDPVTGNPVNRLCYIR